MRVIDKGAEPVELTEYRAKPDAIYDGPNFTPVKERVRDALLAEQGHLCAYCLKRIAADSMKVEHWRSQTKYPEAQLEYRNLLGCCLGNEGGPYHVQHCDTRKADKEISFNPADPDHAHRMQIRFLGNGVILSDDPRFNRELEEVLNLNWTRLKENRKSVINNVTEALGRRPGKRTPKEIQRKIEEWNRPDATGRLKEYCAVAVYYLEKKLRATRSS